MFFKFIGIWVVFEMIFGCRVLSILGLIGIVWGVLLLFGMIFYFYNFIWLFFNGLFLGMIWGIVFSFLEGCCNIELFGVGMSVSFIVVFGLVKVVGKIFVESYGIFEFWMFFLIGLVFVFILLLGVWMFSKILFLSEEDEVERIKCILMDCV